MAPVAILCGLLAGAMWGLVFITPVLLGAFSPLELAVGRYVAYGAIAALLLLRDAGTVAATLRPADLLALARQALTGGLGYYLLLAMGVRFAGVAPTSMIIGLIPVVATFLGRHDTDAPPLSRMAIPLLCIVAGVALLNTGALLRAQADGSTGALGLGLACATGALCCWSGYAVDNARHLKHHPQWTSAQWSGLYGLACGIAALAVWAAAATFADGTTPFLSHDRRWFWTCNLALALVTSVVANQLWNIASRRAPVSLSVQLGSSETLFALLYGVALSGRNLETMELVAAGLLVASLAASVFVHTYYRP